jgi:hypothetical protein
MPVKAKIDSVSVRRNTTSKNRCLQLGLGRIGFHVFHHTYRAWLNETGAPVDLQQKLMRHAHVSATMDQYGNASIQAKPQGQSANRATPLEKACQPTGLHAINKRNCAAVLLLDSFGQSLRVPKLPVTL